MAGHANGYEFDPENINPLLPGLGGPSAGPSANDMVHDANGNLGFRTSAFETTGRTAQDSINTMRANWAADNSPAGNPNSQQNVGESRNAHFDAGVASSMGTSHWFG